MDLRDSLQRWFGGKVSERTPEIPPVDGPPSHVLWAMQEIPVQDATQHFLVAGSPQSGKTITIRMLMQSVIPYVGRGFGHRAFVYDAKREFMPLLAEMWGKEPITLDPFDQRGHPWDMAADIETEADAAQLAGMLIPDEPNATQRYFPDAARDLLRAVLIAFIESVKPVDSKPKRWTFRDVLLALEHVDLLTRVVHKSEASTRIAARYLDDERSLPSVMSTIATKMQPFSVVAGLWASSQQPPVSLTKWLDTEGVLVVASHPRYSESLRPLNQAIFRRISDLVLSRPDTDSGDKHPWRTWFFLDEVREAGRLNGLHPLLNMGRSKGACMVLGFQDIAGFQAEYGDKIADELAGQCAYKSFLRTGSQITAQWAQAHFGQADQLKPKFSESESYDKRGSLSGSQISVSYDYVLENAVLASELLSLPAPGPETGMVGFHDTPRYGAYRSHASWDWIMQNLWNPSKDNEAPVDKVAPRDPSEQKLHPWKDEDFERLWPDEKLERVKRSSKASAGDSSIAIRQDKGPETSGPGEPAPSPPTIEPGAASESLKGKTDKKYQDKLAELFKIERPR